MASPTIQRSPTSSSPLQRLSTFKERTTTTTTTTTTLTAAASTPPSSAITITPLNSLASDPIFSAFLSHDFDSARFSSLALSPGSAAARAEKLQDGIRLLEKQLRSEVLSRHHHLLSQLFSVREADSALFPLRSAVSNLHSSVRHVRSEIADPHRQIRAKTLQLSSLHHTAELLQATIRVLRLSKKLRDVMDPFDHSERLDLAKAAQLHCEILTLCNENDQLTGIAVVDEELDWVFEAGQKLRSEGMRVLERGLEGLNQAEVGAGLQVFYNLG